MDGQGFNKITIIIYRIISTIICGVPIIHNSEENRNKIIKRFLFDVKKANLNTAKHRRQILIG